MNNTQLISIMLLLSIVFNVCQCNSYNLEVAKQGPPLSIDSMKWTITNERKYRITIEAISYTDPDGAFLTFSVMPGRTKVIVLPRRNYMLTFRHNENCLFRRELRAQDGPNYTTVFKLGHTDTE